MKMTKRIFALVVCAVMLATSCIFVNAAPEDKATITIGETVNINEVLYGADEARLHRAAATIERLCPGVVPPTL